MRTDRPIVPQPRPIHTRRANHFGALVLGVLCVLVLIGIAADAFIRPAYWLIGMP